MTLAFITPVMLFCLAWTGVKSIVRPSPALCLLIFSRMDHSFAPVACNMLKSFRGGVFNAWSDRAQADSVLSAPLSDGSVEVALKMPRCGPTLNMCRLSDYAFPNTRCYLRLVAFEWLMCNKILAQNRIKTPMGSSCAEACQCCHFLACMMVCLFTAWRCLIWLWSDQHTITSGVSYKHYGELSQICFSHIVLCQDLWLWL